MSSVQNTLSSLKSLVDNDSMVDYDMKSYVIPKKILV